MTSNSSLRRALVLLCGPPLTWFLHLNALYAAATRACRSGVNADIAAMIVTLIAVGFLAVIWKAGRSTIDVEGSLTTWSRALASLSALAIAWSVLAAILAPRGCP